MNTNETPAPETPESVSSSPPPPLPSPDLTTSSIIGKPLEAPPAPNAPRPLTEQEKKDMKGCGIFIAVPLGLIILWFISRDLLMGLAWLAVAGGISYAGIKAKKNKLLSIGGGILAAIITLAILDPIVPERGIVSKSDLKNPKTALEKLGKKAFVSVEGVESVEVNEIGYGEGRYSLDVTFHAYSLNNNESTLKNIRFEMERAYQNVLKYPELTPDFVRFTAQLPLQDQYGNERGLTDVYRTVVKKEEIEKLNREKLQTVKWQNIWTVTYVHPIFSAFDRENY
jgi:hypothetical protein